MRTFTFLQLSLAASVSSLVVAIVTTFASGAAVVPTPAAYDFYEPRAPLEDRALSTSAYTISSNQTLVSVALPAAPTTQSGLAAGSAACSSILRSVGPTKYGSLLVNTVPYVASRNYWNVLNGVYTPACVIYPTTAQDVSTSLIAIKKANSTFAIKAGGHNPNKFFSSVVQNLSIFAPS